MPSINIHFHIYSVLLSVVMSRYAGDERATRRGVIQNTISLNNTYQQGIQQRNMGRHITTDKEPGKNTGLINREHNQEEQKQVE